MVAKAAQCHFLTAMSLSLRSGLQCLKSSVIVINALQCQKTLPECCPRSQLIARSQIVCYRHKNSISQTSIRRRISQIKSRLQTLSASAISETTLKVAYHQN